MLRGNSRAKIVSGDFFVDEMDEGLGGFGRIAGDGVIVNLSTKKDKMTTNSASIKIAFMSRILKPEFTDKECSNQALEANTSFRVSL